jgi:NAD(P)-dependent dehydrogenase (short-subunit alcohol dehydrogenase family)
MTDRRTGRVALVTGGSSGIGYAAAAALLEQGLNVMICGLDADQVATATGTLTPRSASVAGRAADVTDEMQVAELIAATVAEFGGIDVLVTAAGIQRYGSAAETSAQLWDLVLDVNVKGAFLAVKHAIPELRRRGGGAIVIVSSVQAFMTQTSVAAYSTSKGALNALTRSVAVDEARHGIRANAVCPASVDTPMLRAAAREFSDGTPAGEQHLVESWGRMHPLGRVARASEVGDVIAFLASDRASFVTGISVPVDGGLLAAAAVVLPE